MNIEDVVEILLGLNQNYKQPVLSLVDQRYLKNIHSQIQANDPLTDYQVETCLGKIRKYRHSLLSQQIDVKYILENVPLRMPMKTLDHKRRVYLEVINNRKHIIIKYSFSNIFDIEWTKIANRLTGQVYNSPTACKTVEYSDQNLLLISNMLSSFNFHYSDEVLELLDTCNKILQNRLSYIPQLEKNVLTNEYELKNVSDTCTKHFLEHFGKITDENYISAISALRNYGIYGIFNTPQTASISRLSFDVLSTDQTRFRVLPSVYSIADLTNTINELSQWPVLMILDDNANLEQIKGIVDDLTKFVEHKEINIFFRPTHNEEFSQYIRSNNLNNYINEKIKVVVITKNKLPKPLVNANWYPASAIVVSQHDHGKPTTFLNGIPTVYYYNDSITAKYTTLKGTLSIHVL